MGFSNSFVWFSCIKKHAVPFFLGDSALERVFELSLDCFNISSWMISIFLWPNKLALNCTYGLSNSIVEDDDLSLYLSALDLLPP